MFSAGKATKWVVEGKYEGFLEDHRGSGKRLAAAVGLAPCACFTLLLAGLHGLPTCDGCIATGSW